MHAGPHSRLVSLALGCLLAVNAAAQSLSRNPHPHQSFPPTAPRGLSCGPTLLTESVSQDIISGNSIACSDMGSGFTFETHYARAFNLPSFGIDGFFEVCEVEVAVEAALSLAGTQPLTVYLYSTPLGSFPGGPLTPIGTATVQVPDQDQSYVTVPVDGLVPPQSALVADVASEDGTVALSVFYIGSNASGQTAPGYITAPACGFATPTDLTDAGFPDMHMVINVHGTGLDTGIVPPPPPECPATSSLFANTTPAAITDNGVTISTIDVSGAGSYIWDVNMITNILHTFPDDLDITLTSPQGTVVTITTDNGGGNDNVFDGTIWDDQANPGGQVPYTENNGLVTDQAYLDGVTASPLVPEEAFGAFIGEDPNGTWTLTISDDQAGDTGTLDGWSLAIATLASPPGISWQGFWSNTTPVPIADNAVTTSMVSVAPSSGTRICQLKVTTDITHTSAADLDITLTSPQGTVVTLTTDNGGGNDDVFAGTTWDDKANPGGQVPYVSNDGLVTDQAYVDLTPVSFLVPEEALAAFNGENPTGNWTLTISDDQAGEVGTLNSWSLLIHTCSCAAGIPDVPLRVDAHAAGLPASRPTGSSNLNDVLELGETVEVEPSWSNDGTVPFDLYGFGSNLSGPPGPTYNLLDDYAAYGTVNPSTTANCFDATGDCYVVQITGTRPAQHFDATFDEYGGPIAAPTGVGTYNKTWTLHVGESFPDVATSNQFYRFIETIFHNGVTGGCGGGNYCPDNTVTRAQMAVFLLKASLGSSYVPPACTGTVFLDVPCTGGIFDPWIEDLAGRGITGGCGGGNYCPGNPVTRAQMAVFLLKALLGSGYTPPACTGAVFLDVPCTGGIFDPWIEDLAGRSITGGCGGGNYCPGSPNTRGQMAVFLTKTFNLLLYGP